VSPGCRAASRSHRDRARPPWRPLPTSCAIRRICRDRCISRPPPIVRVDLETVELTGQLDDKTRYNYWTFNGKVPGPFLRVRVGDTVEVHIKNDRNSVMVQSVDFHGATGPDGGPMFTQADPGQEKIVTFKALVPGLFVYHCATPSVPHHITNGMYGLILVEPEGGLPQLDREFYIMQGELYTAQPFGTQGDQEMDYEKLISERPEYFLFNGSVGALIVDGPMDDEIMHQGPATH
jgi:nitrite reductase (NO-forming)